MYQSVLDISQQLKETVISLKQSSCWAHNPALQGYNYPAVTVTLLDALPTIQGHNYLAVTVALLDALPTTQAHSDLTATVISLDA
jgi:hypothetical protein